MNFEAERQILEQELKQTRQELDVLQKRLSQLPDVSGMKAQLAYLKGDKQRPRPVRTYVKKTDKKHTRRKKAEMIAFRSDIRQAAQMVGRKGKVFQVKNVINTLKTQGYEGHNADMQIAKKELDAGVKNGWLTSPSRGHFKLV